MIFKTGRYKSLLTLLLTGIFSIFSIGISFAQTVTERTGHLFAGVREVLVAGLIIAVLTAVYSIILTQKDEEEGGDGCACGRKSRYT